MRVCVGACVLHVCESVRMLARVCACVCVPVCVRVNGCVRVCCRGRVHA